MKSHRQHLPARSLLHEAKERLTIPALWKLRQWPGEPGKTCTCPYRADKNPSGSIILPDGHLFHDFSSGETFDAPALLAIVENLDASAACKLFIELAGVRQTDAWRIRQAPPRAESRPTGVRETYVSPELEPLSADEIQHIAEARRLSAAGVTLACDIGLLRSTHWRRHKCWVITDKSDRVAQARRFDGQLFGRNTYGSIKSWTFPGGTASWPVGILEAADAPSIALVEGGPDLLAACHFIVAQDRVNKVAPVAMLGASVKIASNALACFDGKRVRIFAHADIPKPNGGWHLSPGIEAAWRWQEQLKENGATVDVFDLSGLTKDNGSPVNDLNDLTSCDPSDWSREADQLNSFMHF